MNRPGDDPPADRPLDSRVPERGDGVMRVSGPRWRVLTDPHRSVHKRLGAQLLAQADVTAPDGKPYLVRIYRNAPVVGTPSELAGVVGQVDVRSLAGLIKANVRALGDTGWRVTVATPAATRRPSLTLFRQDVHAAAPVVDIALVIVDAVRRGDQLWDDET